MRGNGFRRRQHYVGVGSGETETADSGPVRAAAVRKGGVRTRQPHREGVPGDGGVGCVLVKVRGYRPVLEAQHGLDQAGHTGGGLRMTDVRLGGAHQARLVGRAARPQDLPEDLQLHLVADAGAGAVRFEVVDFGRADPRLLIGAQQDVTLPFDARRDQVAAALAVVADRAAQNDRPDPVTVGPGPGQRLEDDDAHPVTAHKAVGRRVTELAAPVLCQHPGAGIDGAFLRQEHHVGRAGHRHGGLARPDRLGCHVHGRQ
ncbi:hypothetical protein EES44_17010 [Streptomyces sp. ADI96-15]|nr:hypothetical protein EES44_17010 [Streptomyces sp. ADI96-15]